MPTTDSILLVQVVQTGLLVSPHALTFLVIALALHGWVMKHHPKWGLLPPVLVIAGMIGLEVACRFVQGPPLLGLLLIDSILLPLLVGQLAALLIHGWKHRKAAGED